MGLVYFEGNMFTKDRHEETVKVVVLTLRSVTANRRRRLLRQVVR